jgi:imidazolonepropionase-like amidohydrolase
MDEATATLMAEKDIWLSTQPFVSDDDAPPMTGQSQINLLQVIAGTNTVNALAKEHKIKTAFGTDLLFSNMITERQGFMMTHLTRWYDNADILKMATSVNAELLAMSGPRNPYHGKLGIIEEDALADLLVVDGNPIDDIELVAGPDKNFMVAPSSRQRHPAARLFKRPHPAHCRRPPPG